MVGEEPPFLVEWGHARKRRAGQSLAREWRMDAPKPWQHVFMWGENKGLPDRALVMGPRDKQMALAGWGDAGRHVEGQFGGGALYTRTMGSMYGSI